MPTRERLEKARGAFEIGGDGSRRIVRMLDAPLEQMRTRGQLTENQYQTLVRVRMHWFIGYHGGSLQAIYLGRVTAHNRDYGMASSEQEIWHREMFGVAFGGLLVIERDVVTMVVIQERSLAEAGTALGYHSPYRARQAALECLRGAAAEIMSAWLTMDKT
jgi:hypothetical protein